MPTAPKFASHNRLGSETALSLIIAAGHWVVRTAKTLAKRYRNYRERQAALDVLHRMDARELKDIGVYRSDIDAIVKGLYRGRD